MPRSFHALALVAALVPALLVPSVAHADITIGASLPLTGPASGLGIPMNNGLKLWPATIAGEKVRVIVLDDATDPTQGVLNARKFTTDDKVDLILGAATSPVGIAMADVALESQTPLLLGAPAELAPGKDAWAFRMPQANAVMATAMVEHMARSGVKTVGFLGYADAYGESWLKEFTRLADRKGIRVAGVERYARADTSVTGQVLKLVALAPDAILIVAAGSGAAMPNRAVVERGYKGKVYQTHAAGTRDLMRLGGKEVEGTYVVSGPVIAPEQLPDANPSKKLALQYVQQYEAVYGAGTRNQFAGHVFDLNVLLQKAVPIALKQARPGTPEFRRALRDVLETMGPTTIAQGVLNWTRDDHWGYTDTTGVMVRVVNGDWKVE